MIIFEMGERKAYIFLPASFFLILAELFFVCGCTVNVSPDDGEGEDLLNDEPSLDIGLEDAGFELEESESMPEGSSWMLLVDDDIDDYLQRYHEKAVSVAGTADGGIIIAGGLAFLSLISDVFILKLDGNGNKLWQSIIAGGECRSMEITAEGGMVLCGVMSDDGWVIKTDGNGAVMWQETLGGPGSDGLDSVIECSDEGIVAAGNSRSFSSNLGDLWIVKMDGAGHILWQKVIGGPGLDWATSVYESRNGGYVVIGKTSDRILILKLDVEGNLEWQRSIGGIGDVYAFTSTESTDGGILMTGRTDSCGSGRFDMLIVKLDDRGNILWQKSVGGSDLESGDAVIETADGGFVVGGSTYPYSEGSYDMLILKMSGGGDLDWQKTLRGSMYDLTASVMESRDGAVYFLGESGSFGDGDTDLVVGKLSGEGVSASPCSLMENSDLVVGDCTLTIQDANLVEMDSSAVPQEVGAESLQYNLVIRRICPE
jgi:hypothetical protein